MGTLHWRLLISRVALKVCFLSLEIKYLNSRLEPRCRFETAMYARGNQLPNIHRSTQSGLVEISFHWSVHLVEGNGMDSPAALDLK